VTKEARQELRELWAERVEAFLASGLSQRAWCREHGLKQERLSYWLRKFRAEASAKIWTSSYLGQKPYRITAAQPGNDANRPLPLQGRGVLFLYPDPRPVESSERLPP
jgi:hypothetical protein